MPSNNPVAGSQLSGPSLEGGSNIETPAQAQARMDANKPKPKPKPTAAPGIFDKGGLFDNIGQNITNAFDSVFGGGGNAIQDALDTLPELPDFRGELTPLVDEAVQASRDAEDAAFAAHTEDDDKQEALAQDTLDQTEDLVEDIGGVGDRLTEDQDNFDTAVSEQENRINAIGPEVDAQFQIAKDEFGVALQDARDNVGADREAALGGVFDGISGAMEAAVQGVQSTVRNSIAQIDANQNLTPGQKEQMKAQVRMNGAMNMSAAVGATQLGFNTLLAETSVAFGDMLTRVETAGLEGTVGIGIAAADAGSQARIAAGELSNELLTIRSTAAQGFAAGQGQLLALRNTAELSGNELAGNLMQAVGTPHLNYTESAVMNLGWQNELMVREFANQMTWTSVQIQGKAAIAMQGNWWENALSFGGKILGLFT